MRIALLVALSLPACGGREIPRGVVESDASVVSTDIVFEPVDRVVPVLPDGASGDAAGSDGAGDATSPADGGSDVAADARLNLDVPPPVNRLCGFDEPQVNAVAVKLATCFRLAPQPLMERLWRTDTWEGGQPYTARVCDVFRLCVALAATRGCPAVLSTCMKMSVAAAPNDRCEGISPSCNGVRLRSCAEGLIREDSCQANMRECVASGGEGACVQSMSAPCVPGSPPRCEGDTLQRCVTARWVSVLDCGRDGARCDAAGDRCVGGGAPCNGDFSRCDGTVLIRCRGGREHRQDCGLNVRNASCRAMGGEVFCGVAAECDPTRSPSTGTCEGPNLSLCAGGRAFRFDCAANGFGACGSTGCGP